MLSFAAARRYMIDGQLRINDVTEPRLIGAIQAVPRENFVPEEKADLAYLDLDLPVFALPGRQPRCLLKPIVLARLMEIAAVKDGERVLDVACGTGYSTAILSHLAGHVVALEEDAALSEPIAANCAALGRDNVTVRTGPLAAGAASDGPFDVIFINGAIEFVPESLGAQLKDGGRLVCVLKKGPVGRGMLYLSTGGVVSGRAVFDAVAPLLPEFVTPPAFAF